MTVTNSHDRLDMGNLLISTTTSTIETRNNYDPVEVKNERANWSNRVVYLLSIIGFVVDLGKYILE